MPSSKVSGLNTGSQSVSALKDVINQVKAKPHNGMQHRGVRKNKSFDFSRAVNGTAESSKPGPTMQNISFETCKVTPTRSPDGTVLDTCGDHRDAGKPGSNSVWEPQLLWSPPPVDTHNRFLVLDFQESFKYNKLVGDSLDSCMTDQTDPSVKDPDKCNKPPQENLVCQVNRDFIEGVRILPSSIVSPPKVPQQPSGQKVTSKTPRIEEVEGKDYGISDAHKLAISSRLCGPTQAVRAVDMDNWEQGEQEFFEDQVKAMGLDYDYCVEDVESDEENGTAQFFAAQMKVGMPKVPLPTSSQSSQ
ncbi:hypothetical protein L1987_19179 [Smallanthus sonchifolius]|uniref:Uncharacterized protein n=1 Tax=Smallanthus sonchifolius TaxID=185202 RepID=A0ACB9INR7_9ASTR|nr:hypothetical protein L1987_19179 [Smallanthus sonchifolius]